MRAFLLVLLLAASAGASPRKPGPPQGPEDLGAAELDVSSYPAQYQETYRRVFLPLYAFLPGGPARAINSPLVTSEEWRKEVMRIKNRPPCCGACPILSMEDAKALWRFLTYDSQVRKTGPNAAAWAAYRRGLADRFQDLQKQQGRH